MSAAASANFPWSLLPEPPAGRKRFDWLRLPGVAGEPRPCLAARGRFAGPSMVILADLGAASAVARAAALRLAEALDAEQLHGGLLVMLPTGEPVPVELPFAAGAAGSYRDRLAHALASEIIAPADVVVDVRGPAWDERNAGVAVHYLDERGATHPLADEVALAVGMPYTLAAKLPAAPTTPTAWAARLGRAAVVVQLPDTAHASAGARLFDGLVNGLRAAGMLAGSRRSAPTRPLVLAGIVVAPVTGFWEPAPAVAQELLVGDALGAFSDAFGGRVGRLDATLSGVVVSHRAPGWVARGAPLAVIGS